MPDQHFDPLTGEPIPAPQMCDFCSEPGTDYVPFGCADFQRRVIIRGGTMMIEVCRCHVEMAELPGDQVLENDSLGSWAACPACAALIEADDRDGLADRVVGLVKGRHPEFDGRTAQVAAAGALISIEGFWLHRTGSERVHHA